MRAWATYDASANFTILRPASNLEKQSFRELFFLLAIFCCSETDTVGNASLNDWGDIQAGEIMSLTREWGKFPTFEFKCYSYR